MGQVPGGQSLNTSEKTDNYLNAAPLGIEESNSMPGVAEQLQVNFHGNQGNLMFLQGTKATSGA